MATERTASPFGERDISRVLDRQPWASLVSLLSRIGVASDQTLPRLRRYAEMLLQWNRGFSNLISASDESRLVERHLIESIAPAAWINELHANRFIDFGSGGGLPAIPLALAGIGERWVLVESRRNKTLFLRKVIEELGLDGVEVELGRLEMLLDDSGRLGKFDVFTSRATLRLGPSLSLAANWVSDGGHAFLWKGSRKDQEMADDTRWSRSWAIDGSFVIGDGPSSVVRFKRKTV